MRTPDFKNARAMRFCACNSMTIRDNSGSDQVRTYPCERCRKRRRHKLCAFPMPITT